MATMRSKAPIGWPLLPLPDENGQLNYPTLAESVRQTIQVILSTRPGEQLMHPRFGAGLENFLHQPNDLGTRQAIHDAIVDTLAIYEPRATVERVAVDDVAEQPGHLRIEIVYRLHRSGQFQQMGITLEMEG